MTTFFKISVKALIILISFAYCAESIQCIFTDAVNVEIISPGEDNSPESSDLTLKKSNNSDDFYLNKKLSFSNGGSEIKARASKNNFPYLTGYYSTIYMPPDLL